MLDGDELVNITNELILMEAVNQRNECLKKLEMALQPRWRKWELKDHPQLTLS